MNYTLYILKDLQRDKFYIGQTSDLSDRLNRHINKRSKYTKTGNWILVYKETYNTHSEAIKREKYLKSLKSKIAINKLINQQGPIAQPG